MDEPRPHHWHPLPETARVRFRTGALLLAGLSTAALVVVACKDVVVEPADVASVRVTPESAELAVGTDIQLSAQPFDGDEVPLVGYRVTWSTDDDRVAAVDGQGRVTGVGQGSTVVRAAVGSAEGAASVAVVAEPVLELDRESVGFIADAGGGAPPAVQLSVRNGGGGTITGLDATTSYQGTAAGWLTATLDGTTTPATLTLMASPGDLGAGTYGATVHLTSPVAANSPVDVPVSLEVRTGQQTTSPPAAPSGLAASALSSSAIQLSWSDNSGDETEFRIERKSSASFALVATVGTDTDAYTDDGLAASTAYTYRVRACNSAGCSAYSGEATANTDALAVPAAPSDLVATTAGPDRIDLTWSDNSGDETAFRLERQDPGGAQFYELAVLAAGTASYADGAVEPDGRYTYRVRACSDNGCSAYSGSASALTPPWAPGGLTAVADGTDIQLAWDDLSTTESRFEIQRREGSGSFAPRATVEPNVTSFGETGLDPGVTYTYRVRACNAGGCSVFSGEASAATAPPVPPTPTGLTAAYSEPGITLEWEDLSPWEEEYQIERRVGGDTFKPLTTTAADVTTYQDTDLVLDTEYHYRVRACNVSGCSSTSQEVKLSTPPTAPSNLRILPSKSDRVKLGWDDNSDREDLFRIERAGDDGVFAFLADVARNDTDYEDRSVSRGTSYSYRVSACNESGCSTFSNVVATTTDG